MTAGIRLRTPARWNLPRQFPSPCPHSCRRAILYHGSSLKFFFSWPPTSTEECAASTPAREEVQTRVNSALAVALAAAARQQFRTEGAHRVRPQLLPYERAWRVVARPDARRARAPGGMRRLPPGDAGVVAVLRALRAGEHRHAVGAAAMDKLPLSMLVAAAPRAALRAGGARARTWSMAASARSLFGRRREPEASAAVDRR